MMKDEYVTSGNIDRKAGEWLAVIDKHPGRRERFKFDMGNAALLVLDMQRYFIDADSHAHVPASRAIIPNIRSLIGLFRKAGRPVVFTRHSLREGENPGIMNRWWRDTVREGTAESTIADLLDVRTGDVVIRKSRYSAFRGTKLESTLRAFGVQTLVITGVTTHLCCDSTARDAFMSDFSVFFVVDATATWNEDLHVSTLKTLADGFAIPVSANEMIGLGGKGK